MVLFDVNDELYSANSDPNVRFFVDQGGTSSGKTYCLMQRLIELSIKEPRAVITVAGQDLPNLKVGALRDMENIVSQNSWLRNWFVCNKSDHYYRGKNFSLIEFKAYKDAQDAKNGKRDYLFVNEANGITYEVFWQLAIRTRKQVFIDYNPSARFWVHDKIIGRKDCKLIISDHRSNRFLSKAEHDKIENISDKELWEVYARGITGKITGLIYTNWDIVDELPPVEECKIPPVYGLDFGYANDPTALEEIRLAHGDLWIDEYIYQPGLLNCDSNHREPNIVDIMRDNGITRHNLIVADCAEQKSIDEIKKENFWIIASVKGAGSIVNGIDVVKRYRMHVTRRSVGAISELGKYKWAVDRDGNSTNQPIDRFNHAMDAIRYAAQMKLGVTHTGTARATVGRYNNG